MTENIINKVLEIENSNIERIMSFAINGNMHLWPLIRFEFLMKIIYKELNLQQAHASMKIPTLLEVIKFISQTLFYNPFSAKHKDILIFGSGASNITINGFYFNRVNEYFVEYQKESTNYMEQSIEIKTFIPRKLKYIYFRDYLYITILLKSKFSNINKHDSAAINDFMDNMCNYYHEFDIYPLREYFTSQLIIFSKKLPYYLSLYSRLLQKINPQILFIEDGSYGSEKAIIIDVAKRLGIKVGEFQHGTICPSHHAYNYPARVKESEYSKYLPDFLLTYGEYWSNVANTCSKKIIIGNPNFEKRLNELKSCNSSNIKKIILIVSQGTVTKKMVELAKKINKLVEHDNELRIIFRLHPGEVGFAKRYQELFDYQNIEVSQTGDIYDLIAQSDYIVGSSSTTLFESKAFDKPVYVYKNDDSELFVSKEFGIWFESADELLHLLKNKDRKWKNEKSFYWADNWKMNYEKFLKNEIGIA